MTKPLTSTAIMMLYEEGRFQLDDPIARFLPCFKEMRVCVGGMRGKLETVPAERDITFRDLLTHTSGLTYGFMEATPVDAQYRDRGVDFQTSDKTLGEVVEIAAGIPLIAQPGAEWNYSIATDVLGHLVAVISGKPFDRVPARAGDRAAWAWSIPAFTCPPDKLSRFAANYTRTADGQLMLIDDPQKSIFGTAAEDRVGRRWADLDRRRLHAVLPDDAEQGRAGRRASARAQDGRADDDAIICAATWRRWGSRGFPKSSYEGIGFGLGFSVTLDPAHAQILGSAR